MNLSAPIESLVPGLRGRVLTVLARSSRPIALRELSRRVGTTGHSAVKRVLQDLSDEGMVRYALVSKAGQFFELNHDHFLVKHLLDIDHAKDTVLNVIRTQAALWPREPRAVVLFGSVATGQDTAASDIDVLVVCRTDKEPTDDWDRDWLRLVESVYELTGNSLNLVVFTASDWEKAKERSETLVNEVARDGVMVTGTSLRTLVGATRAGVSR
ncbi:MAG: nucleotidyltransferase domain-containing protein [Actinomycetales bacterium]